MMIKNKINIWALIGLYFNFIKKNFIIFGLNFFIPYIFIISLFVGNKILKHDEFFITLILLSVVITFYQSSTIILSLNLEWRLSSTYKRIGLTRIKPEQFILVNIILSIFVALISNLIFLILFVIIINTKFVGNWSEVPLWIIPVKFLATWILVSGFSAFILFLSLFIKTKLTQGILTTIITIVPFILLVTSGFIGPISFTSVTSTLLIMTMTFLSFGTLFAAIFVPLTIYFFRWSN